MTQCPICLMYFNKWSRHVEEMHSDKSAAQERTPEEGSLRRSGSDQPLAHRISASPVEQDRIFCRPALGSIWFLFGFSLMSLFPSPVTGPFQVAHCEEFPVPV